ncbi:MAG: hypothetical protein VB140_02165 [Burkholderia sp.]
MNADILLDFLKQLIINLQPTVQAEHPPQRRRHHQRDVLPAYAQQSRCLRRDPLVGLLLPRVGQN